MLKRVTVRNRLSKVVVLDSIMGSTFIHASFFDKIVSGRLPLPQTRGSRNSSR